MTWERFRELFENEYLSNLRGGTRERYDDVFDLFEELCHPARLRSVNERVVSAFATAMRQKATRGRIGMMASTIRVNLQSLHTALGWAGRRCFPSARGSHRSRCRGRSRSRFPRSHSSGWWTRLPIRTCGLSC